MFVFKRSVNFSIMNQIVLKKGNIFYSLFQDVHNSGEFVFYEEYADESALDIHFKSEYLANFRKRTASMHSKPPSVEVV